MSFLRVGREGINAHSSTFDNNEAVVAARQTVPINIDDTDNDRVNDIMNSLSSLIEDDTNVSKDELTVNNVKFNIAGMPELGRQDIIDKWQLENHVVAKDETGTAGFIFGLQEIYFNPNQRYKAGALEKMGHNSIYDRSAANPRAAILASKNLSVFMDTDLSNGDLVIAKYLTGIPEMPEVYIASLYSDITKGVDCIPINLIKCIKRCQKNKFGFIGYGDLNAHSHLWHSKDTNPRGLVFEEELLTRIEPQKCLAV